MAAVRCVAGTEAASDALLAVVRQALDYPRRGAVKCALRHAHRVTIPAVYVDGAKGWTRSPVPVYLRSTSDAMLPLTDALVEELQSAAAQGRINDSQRIALAAAITGRVAVDLEALAYLPRP